MPQIIPIRDLRNTMEISELCQATNQPIYITKNGYDDMVIMSSKTYDEKLFKMDIYEKLLFAEKQITDGAPLSNAFDVLDRLEEKYAK